ncbi:predicted protein, partial [Nematostella vectensis]
PTKENVVRYSSEEKSTNDSKRLSSKSCAWEISLDGFTVPKKKKKIPKQFISKSSKMGGSHDRVEDAKSIERYKSDVMIVTPEGMAERKVLDLRRWYCMSRPQYKKSCGISSLVSCWNFIFSTLGSGNLRPISQEEVMTILGFKPPFGEIRFGPFTGNATLMRWFRKLCEHFNVRGRAYYLYKPKGRGRTIGTTGDEALIKLKDGLRGSDTAYIYHCHNHYFCPIGYEDTPKTSLEAYRLSLAANEVITWILIGDPSSKHSAIHCKRWIDIDTDLNCENPYHMNIRQLHKGIQERNTKKVGGNLHCIMAFQRSKWQGRG